MTVAEARKAGHCEDCGHPHPYKPVQVKVQSWDFRIHVNEKYDDTQRCLFCQRFHDHGTYNRDIIEVIRHMNWIENQRRWDETHKERRPIEAR